MTEKRRMRTPEEMFPVVERKHTSKYRCDIILGVWDR